MTMKTFRGGAHPPERKSRTEGLPLEFVRSIKQVVVPVNQHFGAPLQPIVKVGDTVKRGQRIADAEGRMTVPVHAPLSGVVKKIEPRMQSSNVDGMCIVIEADGSDTTDFMPPLDVSKCGKDEALKRVRDAGIVGMGGAGFPAHIKLAPPPNKTITMVLANAAECEPYLTIDERMMVEMADDIVVGMTISMMILGVTKAVFGIEDNKKHVVPILEKAILNNGKGMDITVQVLATKYPQGGEKMLISAIIGKEVPSGGLPMDVGCVVQNVGTLKAMADAFIRGIPLIERGFTITGAACQSPKNLIVPIGTLVSDLVPSVVTVNDADLTRVVSGGPMMGASVSSYAFPIQKNTSGVLLMDRKEAEANAEGRCIRCGSCMRACSCRLSPVLINEALAVNDLETAEEIGVMDCVECGTCSYVCPARVQLVQRFRVGKQLIRAKKQKEAQSACK